MTPHLNVAVGYASETGARERNEDYVGWLADMTEASHCIGVTAAIADGVGGARGGRVAAELTVRLFLDGQSSPSKTLDAARHAAAVLDATNSWVHAVGRADPALDRMACTFTALLLRGRTAAVLHVGDTRLYQLRDGVLTRLTTDHVTAAMRNMLTRAIGLSEDIRVETMSFATRSADRYLLCSDGVWCGLPDRLLREALARGRPPEETARDLVALALNTRVGDNATSLVLDIVDLPVIGQTDLAAEMQHVPILPAPRSGTAIDGFTLETMISDGRYSRVFKAHDAKRRALVVKFPKLGATDMEVMRLAFLREAWIAGRVRSPFISEVIAADAQSRSQLYTVMPFYAGQTLEQVLRQSPGVRLATGLAIAARLGKAVATLHRAGVIHRDIKPENVVIESEGGLKLLDLGVALVPTMEDFPAADIPGTASYMAPEMLRGAPGDERTDLFALGVTLYRMFSGTFPYGEIEPFSSPRFGRPTPLTRHRPDLPIWLERTLDRAIAAAPDDRFQDVMEFVFALEHGDWQAGPGRTPPQSLLRRNPLRFYQGLSALLAVLLSALLAWTISPY